MPTGAVRSIHVTNPFDFPVSMPLLRDLPPQGKFGT